MPAAKNGIEVTQDDVTIDLNGFLIRSAVVRQAQTGIFASGLEGLQVRNGTIVNFKNDGISGDERGVVENMRLLSNGARGVSMRDAHIRGSIVANNGFEGITCGRCVIEQNIIVGNIDSGVHGGGGTTAVGNVIAADGYVGFFSTGGIVQGSGYGDNILFGNNSGKAQVGGNAFQLNPNACEPVCP